MDPARLLDRARQAARDRQHRQAIRLCTLGLGRHPPSSLEASLRLERARSYVERGRWKQAEFDASWVVEHAPTVGARLLLARCLMQRNCAGPAVCQLEAVLGGGEQDPWCWELYASALSRQKQHARAREAARHALDLKLRPSTLATMFHVLAGAGEHEAIAELSHRHRELVEMSAELSTQVGFSLNAVGRGVEAVAAFTIAEALEPGRRDTSCGLAHALLRLGQYAEGWRRNEHRQKDTGFCHRLGVPPWQGEPLDNKRLLVKHEQGLGDNIQFARFLLLVRERGAHTTFLVPARLARVLRSNAELGPIQSGHPGFGAADYQTLVMSLPHHLGVGSQVASPVMPYLLAEPDLVAYWRERLGPGPRVGLAWQGNPNYAGEPWRSIPFAKLERVVVDHAERISFLSLQKHFGAEQLELSPLASLVQNLGPEIDNGPDAFVDSLAILSLLDLFITTDTGLAHLAGAAGVRTWVLLSKVCDWRWGVESRSTSWYPSLRLFRQTLGGDWDSVIGEVNEALPSCFGSRLQRCAC